MDSAESIRNQLERVFLEFCDFFYKIEGISVVASKSRYSEVSWLPVKFTVARYSETPWLPVKFTFARYSETGNQLLIPKAKYKSSCKSPTPLPNPTSSGRTFNQHPFDSLSVVSILGRLTVLKVPENMLMVLLDTIDQPTHFRRA